MTHYNVSPRSDTDAGEILRCAQDDSPPIANHYDLAVGPLPPTVGGLPPAPCPWLLRRADQSVVAVLAFLALAATVVWWIAEGGPWHRLIEADRAQQHAARFQVDINTADWSELIQLPGIGDMLAKRILELRQREGPFRDFEDLLRVPGIGPKILERLRPYLRPLPDQQNFPGQ